MKIEIISVNAIDDGAQVILTVRLSDGEHTEKRRLPVFTEQYLARGLSRGSVIDEDTLDELIAESKLCAAMKKGSRLLSYSASSRTRLVSRLRGKGVDREIAEAAAAKLHELGAINEREDIEGAIRGYLKKLWGKRRIANELRAKGYPSELISSALSELDESVWCEGCVALLRKKGAEGAKSPDEIKKITACAVRYGYSYLEVKRALEVICKN